MNAGLGGELGGGLELQQARAGAGGEAVELVRRDGSASADGSAEGAPGGRRTARRFLRQSCAL